MVVCLVGSALWAGCSDAPAEPSGPFLIYDCQCIRPNLHHPGEEPMVLDLPSPPQCASSSERALAGFLEETGGGYGGICECAPRAADAGPAACDPDWRTPSSDPEFL